MYTCYIATLYTHVHIIYLGHEYNSIHFLCWCIQLHVVSRSSIGSWWRRRRKKVKNWRQSFFLLLASFCHMVSDRRELKNKFFKYKTWMYKNYMLQNLNMLYAFKENGFKRLCPVHKFKNEKKQLNLFAFCPAFLCTKPESI